LVLIYNSFINVDVSNPKPKLRFPLKFKYFEIQNQNYEVLRFNTNDNNNEYILERQNSQKNSIYIKLWFWIFKWTCSKLVQTIKILSQGDSVGLEIFEKLRYSWHSSKIRV
jgi:hypothetical protein